MIPEQMRLSHDDVAAKVSNFLEANKWCVRHNFSIEGKSIDIHAIHRDVDAILIVEVKATADEGELIHGVGQLSFYRMLVERAWGEDVFAYLAFPYLGSVGWQITHFVGRHNVGIIGLKDNAEPRWVKHPLSKDYKPFDHYLVELYKRKIAELQEAQAQAEAVRVAQAIKKELGEE